MGRGIGADHPPEEGVVKRNDAGVLRVEEHARVFLTWAWATLARAAGTASAMTVAKATSEPTIAPPTADRNMSPSSESDRLPVTSRLPPRLGMWVWTLNQSLGRERSRIRSHQRLFSQLKP